MKNSLCLAAALALAATSAGAGTVSITTFPTSFDFGAETLTFDDDAWADDAATASTTFGGTEATNPASGADGDLSTATNLNDSSVEIFFTDNVLFNGAGNDLVIFQNTNNTAIGLSNGIALTGAASPARFVRVDEPSNKSGFEIGVLEFDLSDLGIADGAEFTDGLFLTRASIFSTVWDVAALNSRSIVTPPTPDVIPLPAAGWALLAGLGALIGLGRRRA